MISRLLFASLNENVRRLVAQVDQTYSARSALCACCLGAISYDVIGSLCEQVVQALKERDQLSNDLTTPVCLEVVIPPIMDAYRITSRTVITGHADKLFAFPAIDELLMRVIATRLKDTLNIVSADKAKVKVCEYSSCTCT